MKSNDRQSAVVSVADALSANTLMNIRQVQKIVGLSKTPIYARIAKSTFPAPLKLSSRAVRWKAGDILRWLEAQTSEPREPK